MSNYEELLDQNDGWSLYQLLVWFWYTVSNLSQGVLTFMVFVGMQPEKRGNGTNETVYLYNSAVKEWGLYGDRTWVVTLITVTFMTGKGFGQFVASIGDYIGRKPTMFISVGAQIFFSIVIVFCPNWQTMVVFSLGLGLAAGTHITAKAVLYAESVVQKWRMYAFFLGPPLGCLFIDFLAYYGPNNWRYLCLLTSAPLPLLLLLTVYPIQESPKWLIQTRRPLQARKRLERIYRINKSGQIVSDEDLQPNVDVRKGTFYDIWRVKKILLYVALMSYSHFCAAISYYGVMFNLGNIAGNIFVNFAITYVIRMTVNSAIIVVETNVGKIGRRTMHQMGMVVITICTAVAAVVVWIPYLNQNHSWLYRVPCIITMGFSGFLWTAIFVYNSELYPTVVRSQAQGVATFLGCLGSTAAPTLQLMYYVWPPLPYLLLTVLMATNSLLAFYFLPETKGKPLPDMEDFESTETVSKGANYELGSLFQKSYE